MECGKTTLTRSFGRAAFRMSDSDPEVYETVTVYRCIREIGHDAEHYGVPLKPDEETVLWRDDAPPDVLPSWRAADPAETT